MIWPAHFQMNEFVCPCCHQCSMDQSFMNRLESARILSRVPFKINSGFRCLKHNTSLENSSPDSSHMIGVAADISALHNEIRYRILFSLLSVDFNRIGIYKNFIHVDFDHGKNPNRIWVL